MMMIDDNDNDNKNKIKIGRLPKETTKVSTVHSQRQFIFHLYLSFNILVKNII